MSQAALEDESILIQCPSCQTRFAVKQHVLAGIDEPKFHCSRCDNIFQIDGLTTSSATSPAEHEPKASFSIASAEDTGVSEDYEANELDEVEEEDGVEEEELLVDDLEASETVGEADYEEIEDTELADEESYEDGEYEDDEPESDFEQESLLAIETEPVSEEVGEDDSLSESVEDETLVRPLSTTLTEAEPNKNLKVQESFEDLLRVTGEMPRAAQEPLPLPEKKPLPLLEKRKEQRATDALSQASSLDQLLAREQQLSSADKTSGTSATPSSPELIGKKSGFKEETFRNIPIAPLPVTRKSSVSPVIFFSAPLLAFVLLLYAAGLTPGVGTNIAQIFAGGFISAQQEPPPLGLSIEDRQVKGVILSEGQYLVTISGNVANETAFPLRQVMLEATVLSETGTVLATRKTLLGSDLSGIGVKNLSVEMVEDLQSIESARAIEVQPGDVEKFTIGLRMEPGAKPHFFAVRVYSVQR
jgi:predicted Zn finger-like uncharacterized protein